jgi:hypothetical protein
MSSFGLDVSNMGEFISKFISICVKGGKDPIEIAKSEIEEIDVKLAEAEGLRILRYNLTHTLENLGDTSYLNSKKRNLLTPQVEQVQQSKEEDKKIRNYILNSLSKKNNQTVRSLINSCQLFGKDAEVIRMIDALKQKGEVCRTKDGLICLGAS